MLLPFFGKTNGHLQVDAPFAKSLQTLLPAAADKLELPVFLFGNGLEDINSQTADVLVGILSNQRGIVVDADTDSRVGRSLDMNEKNSSQQKDRYPFRKKMNTCEEG